MSFLNQIFNLSERYYNISSDKNSTISMKKFQRCAQSKSYNYFSDKFQNFFYTLLVLIKTVFWEILFYLCEVDNCKHAVVILYQIKPKNQKTLCHWNFFFNQNRTVFRRNTQYGNPTRKLLQNKIIASVGSKRSVINDTCVATKDPKVIFR